jgi:hypothetical protein
VPKSAPLRSLEDIKREIRVTSLAIKIALWLPGGADMDLAKTLISERMGLRILAGERSVRLSPVSGEVLAHFNEAPVPSRVIELGQAA